MTGKSNRKTRGDAATGLAPGVCGVSFSELRVGGEKLPPDAEADLVEFVNDALGSSAWLLYVDGSDSAMRFYTALEAWLGGRMKEAAAMSGLRDADR